MRRFILDFYYITLNELFEQQKQGLNVESKLREIKEKIHNIKTSHLAGAQIRSKTTNLPEIEQTTFYHLAKERRSGTKKTIKSLNTNQGTITGRQEIMQHIGNYYRNLFAADAPTETDQLSTYIQKSFKAIDDTQREFLQKSITEEELFQVIDGASKKSSPGPDGVPYLFYKYMWETVKNVIQDIIQELLINGNPPEGFSDGIIILLPKVKQPKEISEYRPITLINTDYKIITKILEKRMKIIYSTHISPIQNALYTGKKNISQSHCIT